MKPIQWIWKAWRQALKGGFTLLEMLLATLVAGVVTVMIFHLLKPIPQFFQRYQAKQQMTTDSRVCLDAISRALRQGDPASVNFTTPAGAPAWSRIDFNLISDLSTTTSSYAFYWSNQKVYMQEFRRSGVVSDPQLLASNVKNLSFVNRDPRDPSLIEVTLQIDAPYAATNGNVYTLLLPAHTVRMGGAP